MAPLVTQYLTCIALFCSICSLWVPTQGSFSLWKKFLLLSLFLSLYSTLINGFALFFISLIYLLVREYGAYSSTKWKCFFWWLILILSAALQVHCIGGFQPLCLIRKVYFTPDACPYALYFNFDKSIVGVIILGFTQKLACSFREWKIILKQVIYMLPMLVFVMILSVVFNYVKFAPKWSPYLWIWVIHNLFFTCVAEEALFRGWIQNFLNKLPFPYVSYLSLLVTSIIFGMVHFYGGYKYIILATLSGWAYGYAYQATGKIEASILTHFLLNLLHFLFLTYPALA